ncbi:hypothetical protein C3K47_06245 [Solitalea longa]|uniref:SGNH hydrolase-type esterase domain-containing protein n=1 Tax=Solitalea longa TaxID=2079460 RepID=A0A2S5A4Y1_9SPHI|nr:SGNH/GDSL hydrolase family protein [Solitalea longa]POY37359.1 hypothetical protein C3K47_06245 [Solitalea longa]
MNLLFIGDSITKGKLGESFVYIIGNHHPEFNITNLGNDGETCNVIFTRLLSHLKLNNNYDYIILQGGYNDLLLPTFKAKGKLFNFAYSQQLKKGYQPFAHFDESYILLKKTVQDIKTLFNGKLILLTVGCIGEDLSSPSNFHRNEFNQAIRKVASDENLLLADLGHEFELFLKDKPQSAYCLDSFWAITLFDQLAINTGKLSSKRNLFLTIDGIHLNKDGACLFANCILNELTQLNTSALTTKVGWEDLKN